MRKVIAIGGVPASGKTEIVRRFLKNRPNLTLVNPRKLVSAMYDPDAKLYTLGQYTNTDIWGFEGTDKLSMAVQPEAVTFVKECKENILFEGDRLFNQSFLDMLVDLADQNEIDLQIIIISATQENVDARHKDRKDSQSEQFKRGRATKIENIASSFVLMPYITYFNNNSEEELNKVIEHLRLITTP